jgi:glutathione S-transferase
MAVGLTTYESATARTAETYSYKNEINIVDCCLVSTVWGAQRYDVDRKPFPKIVEIYWRLIE